MEFRPKQAIAITAGLALTAGLVAYFGLKGFHGSMLKFTLLSLIPVACIIGGFYALYQVKCKSCGEHWLFKGVNTGASKGPEFQAKVKQGVCPYCGGSLS